MIPIKTAHGNGNRIKIIDINIKKHAKINLIKKGVFMLCLKCIKILYSIIFDKNYNLN